MTNVHERKDATYSHEEIGFIMESLEHFTKFSQDWRSENSHCPLNAKKPWASSNTGGRRILTKKFSPMKASLPVDAARTEVIPHLTTHLRVSTSLTSLAGTVIFFSVTNGRESIARLWNLVQGRPATRQIETVKGLILVRNVVNTVGVVVMWVKNVVSGWNNVSFAVLETIFSESVLTTGDLVLKRLLIDHRHTQLVLVNFPNL